MSVSSEILRIAGNISDALTAIAEKGVTVHAGSTSDDLADLISQIQTGGGGGTTWETVAQGTYSILSEGDTGYFTTIPYIPIEQDSVWRVTWNGTPYILTATEQLDDGSGLEVGYAVGNLIPWGGSTGNNEPFAMSCFDFWGNQELTFLTVANSGSATILVEKQVSGGGGGSTLVPKTITVNGTYDPADDNADGYSEVTVSVPTGVDIPVLTVVYDDNWEYIVSKSFNKTFAECVDYADNDNRYIIRVDTDESRTESYQSSALVMRNDETYIVYVSFDGLAPVEDIQYNSNGTISITSPSSSFTTLNATQNGTYYPIGNYIGQVNVNVPSGQPNLQAKTNINPTTSSQTIQPDSGYDGLSSVQINAMPSGTAGTPTATKGTVSNHSVSVTPSVTNTTGYITGSTKTGTAVTVTASELASGNKEIVANGTNIDVVGYSTVSVAVPSGGSSKETYTYSGLATRTANSYAATSAKVTVTKAGTYNISFVAIRGSSSGTMGTNLYIGNTGKGQNTTWNNGTYGQFVSYTNQQIAANTDVTIYATSGNNSRTIYVGQLIVQEV